jgi:flagellar biosynthetic protein FliP
MVKHIIIAIASIACGLSFASDAVAQYVGESQSRAIKAEGLPAEEITTANLPAADAVTELLRGGPEQLTSPKRLSGSLQIMLLLTVLSLAPAILLMTTSFVRIVVVLGLLRQALGTQQLPPSQVMTALALFMSLLVMTPTWNEVYQQSVRPYSEGRITDPQEAFRLGALPIKRFMSRQIEMAGNSDDVWLFYDYLPESQRRSQPPQSYDEVPLPALLPAFMLSELKVAFLIGFQIYLPFLILDMVVSSVTISMGMMMLPPVIVSLPLKLLLFVLVDGWTLIVGMLMNSFGPAG